jgi:hypothetical protein
MQVLPSLRGVCKPPIQLTILVLNHSTAQDKTARGKTTRASKLPKQRAILATLNKLTRYNYESNTSVS